MISSDVIRGYNDLMILYTLVDKDSYGYEISREIRGVTGEKYIMKETTLYSAFSRLEKNGCITAYPGSETYGKPRTYYHITDLGRRFFAEKCDEWVLTKEIIDKFTGRQI